MEPLASARTSVGTDGCAASADPWLLALRGPAPRPEALDELRAYLRRTLARVLAGRRGAGEADLDDWAQEALLSVLQGLPRFRGESRFSTWAAAVAVRTAFTQLRRRRYSESSLGELDLARLEPYAAGSRAEDPERAHGRRSLLEELHRAIGECLTERQRAAVLGELAGVPSREIARRLGTNPNALYKLVHDARRRLKAALERAGYDGDEVRAELAAATEGEA